MVEIRKAKISDANEIFKLEKEWKKENISWGIFLSKTRKKEIIKEIKNEIWYIAENNKKIIGYINGKIIKAKGIKPAFEIKKGEKYAELNAVYVLKKFRGKKIGDLLIKKLFEDFQNQKIKTIKLKAVSKNTLGLVEYYKKFGFKERLVDMVLKQK